MHILYRPLRPAKSACTTLCCTASHMSQTTFPNSVFGGRKTDLRKAEMFPHYVQSCVTVYIQLPY